MAKANVIVYSTPTCPWCIRVKEFLTEKKVKFTAYNVGDDPIKLQEMIDKSGQMGVPVIDINGEIIVGFNEAKIKQLLGLK
ncbi:glutaredoxin family protein [Candidatus Micrarchaeota archaeon]|nr:glutaredoxin family protein [Candidatus Micrarchaeota archaeon]